MADDRIAQLLRAMLAGQQLNNEGLLIYSAYVIYRSNLVFLATLERREYCLTYTYVLSKQKNLEQVFVMLNTP